MSNYSEDGEICYEVDYFGERLFFSANKFGFVNNMSKMRKLIHFKTSGYEVRVEHINKSTHLKKGTVSYTKESLTTWTN